MPRLRGLGVTPGGVALYLNLLRIIQQAGEFVKGGRKKEAGGVVLRMV